MKYNYSDQCLILAGGYGSRLGKITKYCPKPLLKINKKPFLLYLIKNLYRQGIRNFYILSYYKNSHFKNFPKKFREAKITVIKERTKLGTLGTIINIKKYLKNFFFVVNGDSYFDFNIRDLEFNVLKNSKKLGIALTKIRSNLPKISYEFKKKKLSKIYSSKKKQKYICGGIYYFQKKILKKFVRKNLDIDKDLILKTNYKNNIFAKYYSNDFIDIGTPKDLKKSSSFLNKNILKPCAFLDRDGVINEDLSYVHTPARTKWKKNIFEAIKYLNDNNFRVIILTNQAGIAKGYYNLKNYINYSKWFINQFIKKGSFIDQIYFCPFHPDGKIKKFRKKSNLRKPGNGMIIRAFKDWEIDKKKSFLIGDRDSDILAGKKSSIKSFLVEENIYTQIKNLHNKH